MRARALARCGVTWMLLLGAVSGACQPLGAQPVPRDAMTLDAPDAADVVHADHPDVQEGGVPADSICLPAPEVDVIYALVRNVEGGGVLNPTNARDLEVRVEVNPQAHRMLPHAQCYIGSVAVRARGILAASGSCFEEERVDVDLAREGSIAAPLTVRLQHLNPHFFEEREGYCYPQAVAAVRSEARPEYARAIARRVMRTAAPDVSVREVSRATGMPEEQILIGVLQERTGRACRDPRACMNSEAVRALPAPLLRELRLQLQRDNLRNRPTSEWNIRPAQAVSAERQREVLRPSPSRLPTREIGRPRARPLSLEP